MDNDPRIQLAVVRIRVESGSLRGCCAASLHQEWGNASGRRSHRDDEQSGGFEKISSGRKNLFDVPGNLIEGAHAVTSFFEFWIPARIVIAARLMASCTR
jgi:hypothetical protein